MRALLPAELEQTDLFSPDEFPGKTFDGTMDSFPNYTGLFQWHREIEIICLRTGSMVYYVGGRTYVLEAGDAIAVFPEQLHVAFPHGAPDATFFILFLKEELFHPAQLQKITACYPYGAVLRRTHAKAQREALDLLPLIAQVCRREGLSDLKNLLRQFMLLLTEDINRDVSMLEPKSNTLEKMMQFVQQNLHLAPTVEEIAAAGAVSRTVCFDLFRKNLDKTPGEYLAFCRMHRAAELLRDSDMTVDAIASACGFNSASHFSATFKKALGLTPREYRKVVP